MAGSLEALGLSSADAEISWRFISFTDEDTALSLLKQRRFNFPSTDIIPIIPLMSETRSGGSASSDTFKGSNHLLSSNCSSWQSTK